MDLSRISIKNTAYKEVYLGASSKGNQAKYTNGDIWIKTNYLGYEDYSEYFASRLLEYSNIQDFVKYDLCTFDGKDGCYSMDMLSDEEVLITLYKILDIYNITQKSLDDMNSIQQRFNLVRDAVKDYTSLDITTYLSNLLAFDAVILNEDRHFNNIALIYNEITNSYREAPIFDNGLGFLADLNEYRLETSNLINMRNVKARPFSSSFKKQFRILTPTIRFDKDKVIELIETLNHSDDIKLKRIGYVLNQSVNNYKELFEN